MTPKPVFVLVPGSFSTTAMYYPIQELLNEAGYEVYVNALPSATRNAPEPPASLDDDANFFAGVLKKLADQGKDIMVVGHSYGGLVAAQATKELSKTERQTAGRTGGVVRVIFLSAIVLPEGSSVFGDQGKAPSSIIATDSFGFMRLADPALTASRMYDSWPEDRAVAWARAAPRQSEISFTSTVRYAGNPNIDVSYIFCENDGIVPPTKQAEYINNAKVATGKDVDIRKLATNHVPNLTAPEELARVIFEILKM